VNRSGQDSSPIHSGLLLCLVGKAIGDTRRTRVNRNAEDEAAAGAAAAARIADSPTPIAYVAATSEGVDYSRGLELYGAPAFIYCSWPRFSHPTSSVAALFLPHC
jgi:hypothetical protein